MVTQSGEEVVVRGPERRGSHKILRILVIILFVIALIAGVGYWFYKTQTDAKYDSKKPAYTSLKQIKAQPVPDSTAGKLDYYGGLADAYMLLGDKQASLDNLLKADAAVTDRTLNTGTSYNIAIARSYQNIGNKNKAREYFMREIKRIQNDPNGKEYNQSVTYYEAEMAKL